ncbi:cytochrome P450 [Boletus edulis BED1]|uniref:Cytochrome P450 n=1 Tax=Boletus edulis BED1 TaxID=1328754 RepID=A0AAD4C419_BOLED|nr:cytochrome P450 [Boletus edulis BED1]
MRIITFLGAFVVISRVVKLIQGIKAVGSLPGLRIPFSPFSVPGGVLPATWWNPGFTFVWNWRKDRNVYRRFGRDTTSIVSFVHGSPMIFTRSLEVGRQVLTGGLEKFDKSPDLKGPFSYWGPNIVDEYGDQWRKHRKISSPAFNNETYASVWDASSKLFAEMVSAQGWSSKDVVELPSIYSVMFKFSLTIFTSVGFGAPLAWSKPPSQGEGDNLSVLECLDIITNTLMFAVAAPSWAWKLPFKWFRRTRRAYDIMRVFMRSQVNTIRESIGLEAAKGDIKLGKDLFSLLVHASDDVGGKKGLSDDELVSLSPPYSFSPIGDVFSFLYAGHDTTAQGLTVALAFLALNFDIQDELVSQIREVTEDRDNDTLDYGKLDKVLAAFYEAIRLYPPGPIVPRVAKKDTVLNVSDTDEPRMLFVKKGTHVVVDLVGIHYHPRYYSDPEVYRPSRWYAKKQDQSSNVREGGDFTGFSFGPRSCIGRKYSTTEAVCFLANLLRDWRVEPLFLVHPNGKAESVDEWRERVFRADMMLTLGLKDHNVRLVRRK